MENGTEHSGDGEYLRRKHGAAIKEDKKGFPGGSVVKNPPANGGDTGSNPGPGRSHMSRSN